MHVKHTWKCAEDLGTSPFCVYAGLCNYSHTQNARRHCSHAQQRKSQAVYASCLIAFAMTGWQYKLQSELDRACASSALGWNKIGPTAAMRLSAILEGNIRMHTGVFLQTSPCVSYKWYPSELLDAPVALVLMRNDQKNNGQCRFMIAKPIGALAFNLEATRAEGDMVKIVVTYMSGNVLMELEYAADMAVKEIFDDVQASLEANGGYTQWDLRTVSIVHAGRPLKAVGPIQKLLPGGTGKGSSKAMGQGKGKAAKVVKKPSLKRPSANGY